MSGYDPFARSQPPEVTGHTRDLPGDSPAWRVVALGALLGLGMGLLNLFTSFGESLIVLVWVLLGMAVAWGAWGLLTRRLNPRAALEALLRRP